MLRTLLSVILMLSAMLPAYAADPTATRYDAMQCQGSLRPYPTDIPDVEYPDSLTPVFINHVGRHGSRYPASAANCLALRRALQHADSVGTITETGRGLLALTERAITLSTDRWGALDSLGMAEQRGIATRMFYRFAPVFKDAVIRSLSSYSPRSVMSMYSFTHQLDRLDNHLEVHTSAGRVNSPLMRPFDIDADYLEFRKSDAVKDTYGTFFDATCPTSAIERALGADYPFADDDDRRNLAIVEYYVVAGMQAMEIDCDPYAYFTIEEYNALWSCFNLRQYLQRTASTVSSVPAEIAAKLVADLVSTTDSFIDGTDGTKVNLRFGHAETIMPLVSLLRLPGCYYMTNYFDTVALHWKDFHVVPMAANVQMILFKAGKSGRYYVRFDLNEVPVTLIPNNKEIYLPWEKARDYMLRCVPIYAR